MNAPNRMASAAQQTTNLKLLIYGNLLPLHEPLRLPKPCWTSCRTAGSSPALRAAFRAHQVRNMPLAGSRASKRRSRSSRALDRGCISYQG